MRLAAVLAASVGLLAALKPNPQRVIGTVDTLQPASAEAAPGLQITLRTRDGRTDFHLNEPIPIEVRVSSSKAFAYSIELDRGWNAIAGDVDFVVSPGDAVLRRGSLFLVGYTCCDSWRAFLTKTPETFRYYLTDFIRFLRPGTYQLQYRSHEIFRGRGSRKDMYKERGDVPAISNTIPLTILADDPRLDAENLQRSIALLDDRAGQRLVEVERARLREAFGPNRARGSSRLPSARVSPYLDAAAALSALDTVEAIQERVRRLQMPSESEWRISKGNGYAGIDDEFVRFSMRPDVIAQALEARAATPAFGIQYGYVVVWEQAVAQEKAMPFLLAIHEGPLGLGLSPETKNPVTAARAVVLAALQRLVLQKSGVAREMTTDAIGMLKRDMDR